MYLILSKVCAFAAAYVLTRVAQRLALRPWRKSVGQHWTQRANLLFPARVTAGLCLLLLPVEVAMAIQLYARQAGIVHSGGTSGFLLMIACAFAGAYLANLSFVRVVYPEMHFRQLLHIAFASLLLRGGTIILLGATLFFLPPNFGPLTWLEAGTTLGILLAMQYGLGRQVLVWLRLLKPADDQVQTMVAEIAARMNITVTNVWISATAHANACAMPVTREIIFTKGLLQGLTADQTAAICAHELGHLSESRAVRVSRQIGALAFFPLVFMHPVAHLIHNGFLYPVGYMFLAVGASLLFTRLGRRMEIRADSIAAAQQTQAAIYARALERIYQLNQMPAVMGRRKRVHPDLYDRMTAAGLTPDYAKPRPPSRHTVWNLLLSVGFSTLLILNFAPPLPSDGYRTGMAHYRQWLRDHPDYLPAPYPQRRPDGGQIRNIPLAPGNGGGGRMRQMLFFQFFPERHLHHRREPMKEVYL